MKIPSLKQNAFKLFISKRLPHASIGWRCCPRWRFVFSSSNFSLHTPRSQNSSICLLMYEFIDTNQQNKSNQACVSDSETYYSQGDGHWKINKGFSTWRHVTPHLHSNLNALILRTAILESRRSQLPHCLQSSVPFSTQDTTQILHFFGLGHYLILHRSFFLFHLQNVIAIRFHVSIESSRGIWCCMKQSQN